MAKGKSGTKVNSSKESIYVIRSIHFSPSRSSQPSKMAMATREACNDSGSTDAGREVSSPAG